MKKVLLIVALLATGIQANNQECLRHWTTMNKHMEKAMINRDSELMFKVYIKHAYSELIDAKYSCPKSRIKDLESIEVTLKNALNGKLK